MAKSPDDANVNEPERDIAAEVKALREAFAKMGQALEDQGKELGNKLDEANETATSAAKDAKAALGKADAASKAAAEASKAAKAAEAKAAAADKRAAAVEAQAKKLATELKSSTGELDKLRDALGNTKVGRPQAPGKLPEFLTIRLRQTEFDPIINRVLAEFRAKQNSKIDVAGFSKAIIDRGLATSIGKVSQALSRSRISETRRSVLAAAYPALLKNQLGDPPKARLAKDTAGLAQNLLAQLDLVLDDFAKGVVDASEESLSLDLEDGERKALLARVRESI